MFVLLTVLLLVSVARGFRAAPNMGRLRAHSPAIAMQQKKGSGNADAQAPTAAESAAKNPTVVTSDKFKGMKIGDRPTKKNLRRKIMGSASYKRGGTPFDLAIHQDVSAKMSELFAGELVEQMKESPFRELVVGEGETEITFVLAKQFGFCWGVERSIELAWAARDAYPDKTMHITNELIHNPGVNQLLGGMDIKFMEKDETQKGGKRFDTVGEGDVVILPAFGASLEEMEMLDSKGVTTVDTTCPWVSKVWTTVDKHERADMTSVIHGKYAHEEAIATASMAETYLIIKNMAEAQEVASYILGEEGCLTDEEFLDKYRHAASPHFHPAKHLKKMGLANQTTMYKKETQAIGKLFEKTMMVKYGPENVKKHFAAFDTICDATQVRQDAVLEMSEESNSEEQPTLDFVLVVGGWDSSNTAHLLEIPHEKGLKGYHVNEAKCIRPDNSFEWRDVDGTVLVSENVLPLDRPARIGITSGASTPDSVVQECLEAIAMVKKLNAPGAGAGERSEEANAAATLLEVTMLDPTLDYGEQLPRTAAEQARELLGARGIVAPPKAAKQPPTLAAHGKAEFEKAEAAVAEAYAEGAEAYAAEAEAEAEARAAGGGLGEALPPAGFEWGVTA